LSKTFRTALALIPPADVWPPIQAIRRQHDRHVGRWMPHVTLIYPFRARETWGELLDPLRAACRERSPFTVTLAAFRYFRHRASYTVWLAPEPAAALIQLQAVLQEIVPECNDVLRHGAFTPHLSVGQVAGREQLDRLLAELRASWTPVSFCADRVHLIWRGDPPDDVFRVGIELPLGKAVPEQTTTGSKSHEHDRRPRVRTHSTASEPTRRQRGVSPAPAWKTSPGSQIVQRTEDR